MNLNAVRFSLVYFSLLGRNCSHSGVGNRHEETPIYTGCDSVKLFIYAMALWTGACAFEIGAVNIPEKFLFDKLQYIAMVNTEPLALLFILQFSRSKLFQGKKAIWLWVAPFISMALELTNNLHELVWLNIYQSGSFIEYEPGKLFWFVAVYQYILNFFGIVLLIRYILRGPKVYRHQVVWFLVGSFVTVITAILSNIGINLPGNLNTIPLAICIMGVLYAVAILKFRFLMSCRLPQQLL